MIGIASYAVGMPAATNLPALLTPGPGAIDADLKNYPARDAFDRNEQAYLAYWKSWLERR